MAILPDYETADAIFGKYDFHVSHETFRKLEMYAAFLLEYNQKVNLTAITDGSAILKKHFLDSLLLYQYAQNYFTGNILDIGSGAGFPGVPLALQRPDLQMTLLDSLHKRIVFLEQLREKLHLDYAAVHGRAEDFAKLPGYRERFAVVTARAVASLPVLAELSLPFVQLGGYWIAMKGREDMQPALHVVGLLGGELTERIPYQLPDGDERCIYIIKKISPTSTKYPRKISQIKQKAL